MTKRKTVQITRYLTRFGTKNFIPPPKPKTKLRRLRGMIINSWHYDKMHHKWSLNGANSTDQGKTVQKEYFC
jgi:hypothetical protein